jgi:hypothetical protein
MYVLLSRAVDTLPFFRNTKVEFARDCCLTAFFRNRPRQIRCSDPHVQVVHWGFALRFFSFLLEKPHYAIVSAIPGTKLPLGQSLHSFSYFEKIAILNGSFFVFTKILINLQ